ncbi:MAG: hypothetical protein K1W22_00255 [Lachnospiraceae bacterium]
MGKSFNVTGLCVPSKHFMVNLESRIKQIHEMIDADDYFVINRARQYGKTTTLAALALFHGKEITYTPTSQPISLALMFGFVKNESGKVIPANRIFDTMLYNHFLSAEEGDCGYLQSFASG